MNIWTLVMVTPTNNPHLKFKSSNSGPLSLLMFHDQQIPRFISFSFLFDFHAFT